MGGGEVDSRPGVRGFDLVFFSGAGFGREGFGVWNGVWRVELVGRIGGKNWGLAGREELVGREIFPFFIRIGGNNWREIFNVIF